MTVNQASRSGTPVGRIKSLGNGRGVVLDSLFPLQSVHELGPPPQRRKQARGWLNGKRCEENVK